MAEYTDDHVKIEELPEGAPLDATSGIHPEGGGDSSDRGDEAAAESDSPDSFSDFALSASALFTTFCSALPPDKKIKKTEFTATSDKFRVYFFFQAW